jgi:hypothetical protein
LLGFPELSELSVLSELSATKAVSTGRVGVREVERAGRCEGM